MNTILFFVFGLILKTTTTTDTQNERNKKTNNKNKANTKTTSIKVFDIFIRSLIACRISCFDIDPIKFLSLFDFCHWSCHLFYRRFCFYLSLSHSITHSISFHLNERTNEWKETIWKCEVLYVDDALQGKRKKKIAKANLFG